MIHTLLAQFPITCSIAQNLEAIFSILEHTLPGDLVLFPEGAISGYSDDLSFLEEIDLQELCAAIQEVHRFAKQRKIFLWIGSLNQIDGKWVNRAYGFSPQGHTHTYDKINLAHHERGIITPGSELPVFMLDTAQGPLKVGIQLCREIRYPEQWGWLAREGAQIILHLNNALHNTQKVQVWRSHLISRAAETQRFVLSANTVGPGQLSPTMAIAPNGEVLTEITSQVQEGYARLELDLAQVSNWYLSQCREDVVAMISKEKAISLHE